MFVRYTPARATSSKLLPAALRTAERFRKTRSVSGHNTPFDHLASGRVLADLATEEEETTDFDRLGKRADGRREFGRSN